MAVAVSSYPLLALFLLAPEATLEIFGAEFSGAASALVILSFGQVVNILTGSVGLLLVMSGNERALMRSVSLAAALQLVLCLLLIPSYKAVGAAIATAAGVAALNLFNLREVKKRLHVNFLPFHIRRGPFSEVP